MILHLKTDGRYSRPMESLRLSSIVIECRHERAAGACSIRARVCSCMIGEAGDRELESMTVPMHTIYAVASMPTMRERSIAHCVSSRLAAVRSSDAAGRSLASAGSSSTTTSRDTSSSVQGIPRPSSSSSVFCIDPTRHHSRQQQRQQQRPPSSMASFSCRSCCSS